MRRSWLRVAWVPLLGIGLLALTVGVLGSDDSEFPSPSPPAGSRGASPPERASAPQSGSAAPVASTIVEPQNAPELTKPARAWRAAVIRGQRKEILRGAAAFVRSADTQELVILAQDAHPRVRAYSVRVMGRRKDSALRGVFLRALDDPTPSVRENARWALDQLKE